MVVMTFRMFFGMKFPGSYTGCVQSGRLWGVTIPFHICSQSSLLQGFVGFSRFRVIMTTYLESMEWSMKAGMGKEESRTC